VVFDWPQLAAGVVGAVAVAGVLPRGARASEMRGDHLRMARGV